MKNYRRKMILSSILTIIVYLLFAALVIYTVLHDRSVLAYLFVAVGVIVVIIGLQGEYLKFLYKQGVYYLDYLLDSDKAKEYLDKMTNKDTFNLNVRYKTLLETKISLFNKNPRNMLNIISNNDKEYTANDEMKLLKYYYEVRAYYLLNQPKKISEITESIKGLRKPRKRYLYLVDIVAVLERISLKRNDEAYNMLLNIDTSKLSTNDQKFILEQLIITSPSTSKEDYRNKLNNLLNSVTE